MLQFGLLFSPQLVAPKFSKLNPLAGFQRIFFSPQTLVQFAKQLLKLTIVIVICWFGVKDHLTMLYALAHASPHDIIVAVEGIVFGIGDEGRRSLLLMLGIADYIWEKPPARAVAEDDEDRSARRAPPVGRQSGSEEALRQRQRPMARKRMMAAVPKATVVVTNPTHYAVALEWDELKMDAPVLAAKGADLIAKHIRELAEEHDVPILENPPLARTLYAKVELDSPGPARPLLRGRADHRVRLQAQKPHDRVTASVNCVLAPRDDRSGRSFFRSSGHHQRRAT